MSVCHAEDHVVIKSLQGCAGSAEYDSTSLSWSQGPRRRAEGSNTGIDATRWMIIVHGDTYLIKFMCSFVCVLC